MMLRYSVSNTLEVKTSSTWENVIATTIKMAKSNPSLVLKIKDNSMPLGLRLMESFIWSKKDNNIIPVY